MRTLTTTIAPATLSALVALAAMSGGCGTHFVELLLPADAAPPPAIDGGAAEPAPDAAPPKCDTLMRADGSPCHICYSPDGMLTSDCVPMGGGSTPADAGGGPAAPAAACKVMPVMDTRCLMCPPSSGTAMPTMICLACQAPVKTSAAGDYCRTCAWQDRVGQCLQCFTADGTSTWDDCDALRM